MPSVKVSPVLGGPLSRNDLTPSEYERLIDSKGYRATWEKATFCPARSAADPTDHDINHTACDQGYVYFDPQEIRVLMSGIQTRQAYMQPGRLEPGSAMATVKPQYRLSFLDKITLLDSTLRFTELVTRADYGVLDPLKYEVVNVVDCRDRDHVFTYGVDFNLDTNGNIQWIATGQSPVAGGPYTVSYEHHPVYIVTDLAHDIRDTMLASANQSVPKRTEEYAKLPVQAIVKLHFLARSQSQDQGV